MIDLDHNAGSPLRPEARRALLAALDEGGNASAVHGRGRAARRRLEEARETIAELCGTRPDRVIVTGSGTEANALALAGRRTLASAIEHQAVLAQPGVVPERLPVDRSGRARAAAIAPALGRTAADTVAVMAANNETGVVQPLQAVRRALPAGVRLHVDAVQAPGRLDLATVVSLADTLALSAHKVGGPPGVGALVVGPEIEPAALLRGGGQERGRRAGTENVAGAAGFAAALAAACREDDTARLARLRDRLEAGLRALVTDLVVIGANAPRLASTLCVSAPGWRAERLVIALDLVGVAASSGAACSSGRIHTSHVLEAMDVDPDLREGALRFSLGWSSTDDDVTAALAAMASVFGRRRAA